jgi:hypothetical protein
MNNPFTKKERNITTLSVLLKLRLDDFGLTQTNLAHALNKNQAWISHDLLGDTEKTIRKLWALEPEALSKLSKILEWPIEAMFREMNLYFPMHMENPPSAQLPFYGSVFEFLGEKVEQNQTMTKTINFGLDSSKVPHFSNLQDLAWVSVKEGQMLIEEPLSKVCPVMGDFLVERITKDTNLLKHDIVLSNLDEKTPLIATNNYDEDYCRRTILRPFANNSGPAPFLKYQLTKHTVVHCGVVRYIMRSTFRGLGEDFFHQL